MATELAVSRLFSDIYDIKEEIGQGGYSVVYRCVQKSTALEFAVKIIDLDDLTESDGEDIEAEQRICLKLQHPNIVRLHDTFQDDNAAYLVFDLVSGGELFNMIEARKHYSEADASYCIEQILETLNYCHMRGVVHRDLKPQNILLQSKEKNAAIKLADFGCAVEVIGDEQKWHGSVGTLAFMAPEVLQRKPYGKAVDLWACGVILYLLLVGSLPFDPAYRNCHYQLPDAIILTTEAKNLLNRMLTVDPYKRLTAAEALKDPWIFQRERVASPIHRQKTIDSLKEFNAGRKLKIGEGTSDLSDTDVSLDSYSSTTH